MAQELTIQRYADGSTVLVDGQEWTVVDMSRDSEGLLPSQTDRGEDYNLYRLTRKSGMSTLRLLRWQHELDNENRMPAIHWAGWFWTEDTPEPQYKISLLKKFDPIDDGEAVWNEFLTALGITNEQVRDYFIGDGGTGN